MTVMCVVGDAFLFFLARFSMRFSVRVKRLHGRFSLSLRDTITGIITATRASQHESLCDRVATHIHV